MRAVVVSLGAAALLVIMMASRPVQADVAMTGTFTATQTCPAYQSFRKSTNPGDVKVEPNKAYPVLARNKPDATHYRIVVEGAQPQERWVSLSCGHVDATAVGTSPPPTIGPPVPSDTGARATHVLAMGWEPAFCEDHRDKNECRGLSPTDFAATHVSLHGLWPQPRGRQYCNVAPDLKRLDRDHDWNDLPEPDLSTTTLSRLAAVMPGLQSKLQRHEWIVHGTCFGGTPDSYFARAAGMAEAIDSSKVSQLFADNVGGSLSAETIRSAFDDAFGAGAGARVTISCNGRGENRKITELMINLAGNVTGSAPLGDLIHAAQPVPAGCPSGIVERVGSRSQ
jgi:ribonuclease T2